jgi:peptidoglycan/LPS O-acetylase OafA/YrhL
LLSSLRYRADIDGLRAIAVVGVVAYHAAPRVLPGGFVGVDIFFVISGFLISSLVLTEINQGSFSFLDFYRRRARRILPALIIVIVATWMIGFYALWPNQFADLGAHIIAASTFCSNFLLAAQAGYFDAAASTKPLLHLWSLAIEEQFYLIWPAMLLLASKFRLNVTVLLCLILTASFVSGAASLMSQSPWAFYGLHNRAWELAIGALLAVRRDSDLAPASLRPVAGTAGLLLIAISMLWLDSTVPYPGWRALIPTIGTSFLILAGPHTAINRLLAAKPIVAVGLISYPLYLWHWPFLSFIHIAGVRLTSIVTAAIIGLTVLLAWLTYRFVELPIRHGTVSPSLRQHIPAGLAILLGGTLLLGGVTAWTGGLAYRLDGEMSQLYDYQFDQQQAYRVGTCLLNPGQDESAFTNDCVNDVGAPLLLVWGDSHAAHLFPGLKELEANSTFSLAQYTVSACPPILEIEIAAQPLCRRINDFIIKQISQLRPHTVLLSASWAAYPSADLADLKHSIDQLKIIGVRNIILAGPVPVWTPSLPSVLLPYYVSHHELPERMKLGVTQRADIDDALQKLSAEWGITYFSMLSAFCNSVGCLTRTGNGVKDLVQWDSAHLTPAGSRFIANQLPWQNR